MTHRPAVYLAGPHVFRADAKQYGHDLKRQVAACGMIGLWPLDNLAMPEPMPNTIAGAHRIRRWNVSLIERCAAVLADISPFRGPNMDQGTAFEIGYAEALGKPIFAYSSDLRTLLERTLEYAQGPMAVAARDDIEADPAAMLIEDFGLPENLMISCSVKGIYRSAQEAMLACADFLLSGERKVVQL